MRATGVLLHLQPEEIADISIVPGSPFPIWIIPGSSFPILISYLFMGLFNWHFVAHHGLVGVPKQNLFWLEMGKLPAFLLKGL